MRTTHYVHNHLHLCFSYVCSHRLIRALDRPTELTLERGEKCNLLCDEDRELWLVSRRAKSNAVDSVGYVPPVSYDISESAICHTFYESQANRRGNDCITIA